jgi:hypothetical protein
MTTTAITATLLRIMPEGVKRKRADIDLLLPESWTAAGVALDLSAAALGGFTYIKDWTFTGAGVGDYTTIYNLISSAVGTYLDAGSLLASGCKVVAHQGAIKTGDAQAATVFGSCSDAETPHDNKECHLSVVGW